MTSSRPVSDLGGAVRLAGPEAADDAALLDPDGDTFARLAAAGLAADDDRSLREALPHAAEHPWRRHTLAALFRADPPAMAHAVTARRRHEVAVEAFGHPLGRSLAADLEELCRRTDLPLLADRAPGPPRKDAPAPHPLHVLVGVGEPRRDAARPAASATASPTCWCAWSRATPSSARSSCPARRRACAASTPTGPSEDPVWPLLVEQYARAADGTGPTGSPSRSTPRSRPLAVGLGRPRRWRRTPSGGHPPTLGTTVRISPALETLETQPWPAHPACGCGWA